MQLKDEIDFMELLKNPARLFGLSYIYFLVTAGFIGTYYLWNMNDVSKNATAPVVLRDSTQFVMDIPMQRGAIIPPVDVLVAGRTSKALVDKGANLYKANCASCHGDNGMGDGPSAAAMAVKPRNFHAAEGWKNGRTVANMYKTLQEGIIVNGMAAFNYLPAEDRFALIHYVRTFTTTYPLDSLSALQDLEKIYNLSKGSQLPPQIPVKMAMQKIEAESATDVKLASSVGAAMSGKRLEEQGASLAQRHCANGTKLAAAAMSTKELSLDEFIRTVSSDPLTIGFKASVVRLNREEWSTMYAYLSKVAKERKS